MPVRTGDEDAGTQRCVRQRLVRLGQRAQFFRCAVLGERRLVQLDARGAGLRELLEQPLVLRQQLVQQVEGREAVPLRRRTDLRQQEQRHGSQHDGTQFDPARLRPLELVHHGLGPQRELGVLVEFGLTVVVVGAEEPHQFERREVRPATCHREVEVQRIELALERCEPLGHGTEQQRVVEYVVVVGERVARDLGQTGRGELTPRLLLEVPGDGDEFFLRARAVPVGLEGTLEFAARSDAGIPQDAGSVCCGAGHAVDLSGLSPVAENASGLDAPVRLSQPPVVVKGAQV